PDVVAKARDARLDEIRPCVGANQGCWRRLLGGGQVTCTVNPEAGREAEWAHLFDLVESPGRVLVVGGGPAGLKAAESAARRGHKVILAEREPELGGQLRAAGRLPGRSEWQRYVDHMTRVMTRLGVEIRVGVEVTADTLEELGVDHTVLATGAYYATDGFSIL